MPDEAEEIPSPAGISSPDGVDVAALFARLKDEVQRSEPAAGNGARHEARASTARADAERLWPVTFDQPVYRGPGARGALAHPVKRTLRRLIRWYVEPLARDQRIFNEATLKLVDELHERLDDARRETEALERRAGEGDQASAGLRREAEELHLRLTRVERRGGAPTGTVAAQPAATAIPDYFAFESRMRGSPELIRERQRVYIEDFRDAAPVVDLACGRGELLTLLRDEGVDARGVDADTDMVAFARGEGVDVEQGDVLTYLEGLENGSVGGFFAGQLVEHLSPPALVRLLELVHAKLRPGGLLVAETINPLAPMALRSYFADLTHAQPLVPETLALLVRQAGFARADVRYLNEPPAAERLRPVDLPPEPAFDPARAALAHNVDRLNEQLFGPLDYAVVARR
ncbi:MAG: class I SAM-dependent methyltransferase [Actinobacteria bacterium]|nr:class I SAM-dependent methyltransferase [Actinomycetota bacterium]